MLLVFTLILGLSLLTTTTLGFQEQSVPAVQPENPPSVDQILDRMKIHNEWQGRYLIEYRAQRNFHAANLRFEEDATLEVRTTFRRAGYYRVPGIASRRLQAHTRAGVRQCPQSGE